MISLWRNFFALLKLRKKMKKLAENTEGMELNIESLLTSYKPKPIIVRNGEIVNE